jgi:predicted AAA+ superfamily ATPase
MKRIYEIIVKEHFASYQQMAFLMGQRQVGKTFISLTAAGLTRDDNNYLNWDNKDHRNIILSGPTSLAEHLGLNKASTEKPFVILDEIHKHPDWKNYLKGFYDTYKDKANIIVTGSSKLNVFKSGGDSLMGRYFPYRIHPLSVAECLSATLNDDEEISAPQEIAPELLQKLLNIGGFPEPFLKDNERFTRIWKNLRQQQLFHEDILDLSQIQEVALLEFLAEILRQQAGQLTNYSKLAKKVGVVVDTIKRWITTLENFYYCFTIKPWSRNIVRSLLKEPKTYLWDWGEIDDVGARLENFVACHLQKAVHMWNDRGLGKYGLFFIRDKEKNEVDFLVTKDKAPWFLVEVKNSPNHSISKALHKFQQQTKAQHAFQVVADMKFVNKSCFDYQEPIIVPLTTFLSQLV